MCKAIKILLVSAYFFIEKCFKRTESNSKKFNLFVVLCSVQSISLRRCALSCTSNNSFILFLSQPFSLPLSICTIYAAWLHTYDPLFKTEKYVLVHSLHDLTLIHVEPDLNYPMEYEYLLRPVLPACTSMITVVEFRAKLYIPSTLNNSNRAYTFICLGRAGRFGQC